jgi:hypothetical protein
MGSVQLEVSWVRVLLLTTISVKYVQVSSRDVFMIHKRNILINLINYLR